MKTSSAIRRPDYSAAFAGFLLVLVFSIGRVSGGAERGLTVALALLVGATVWASFHYQSGALAVAAILCVVSPVFSSSFDSIELIVVFVLYQVTASSKLRARTIALVGFVALSINDWWLRRASLESLMEPSVLYPAVLTILGVGIGLQARQLRQQNDELRALRRSDRERAVLDERRRIARDIHDVAAHHLSALVVRNQLARRIDTKPGLEEAVDFSAATAKEALDALRQVVSVLGAEGDSPGFSQPRLVDLIGVLDRLGKAGLEVHAPATFPDMGIRRDVELALVRIAQEALTNVLRHRGPGQAWLSLERVEGMISLVVEDDGPSPHGPDEPVDRPSGHGLIGMKERAEACGGTLTIDRSWRGGWRVTCVLLVAEASRS